MKAQELRGMNKPDLENKIIELKAELMKLNSQIATGTAPKNPSKLREIKRTIAKILTVRHDKNKKEVTKRNE